MNLQFTSDAYLELSDFEKAVVMKNIPRFSPYRVVYWWQAVHFFLGSAAASLSFAWYRAAGGTNFFIVMGGFYILWIGLFGVLGYRYLLRPGARIGLERATMDLLAKRQSEADSAPQQEMPSPDRISST